MRTARQLEAEASQLLEDTGMQRVPVDVVAIAESKGVAVRPVFAPSDVSGGLYMIDGSPVIGVNASHHPNRQRFTIAHELGHWIIHGKGEFVDYEYGKVDHKAIPRFLRDQVSGRATEPAEIEANKFAACLLMPRHLVIQGVRDLRLPLRSESVEELARSFRVSQQAMTFRLLNLNIPMDEV